PASARDLAERYALALEEPDSASEQTAAGPGEAAIGDPAPEPEGRSHAPGTVVHALKAWMPQTVATHKLRAFVQDVGGEVVESAPGRIRVRLGGSRTTTVDVTRSPKLSWLGLSKKRSAIEIELTMNRNGADNVLLITIAIRPVEKGTPTDSTWHERCTQIFCN